MCEVAPEPRPLTLASSQWPASNPGHSKGNIAGLVGEKGGFKQRSDSFVTSGMIVLKIILTVPISLNLPQFLYFDS